MDLDARLELNSRVLRRFDARFSQIIGIASFAVLYSYDKEWTKTDTEGPLFLYQRSEAPFYCLYILNRNDPENFSIGVTPDNDIELSNEFIICRPEHAEGSDIYGIWIFEPSQLKQLGNLIQKCQQSPYPPEPIVPESKRKTESINIDALFANGKIPDSAQASKTTTHVHTESDRNGASILNALFNDTAPPEGWGAQLSAQPGGDDGQKDTFKTPPTEMPCNGDDRIPQPEPQEANTTKPEAPKAERTEQSIQDAPHRAGTVKPSESELPSVAEHSGSAPSSISLDSLFAGAGGVPVAPGPTPAHTAERQEAAKPDSLEESASSVESKQDQEQHEETDEKGDGSSAPVTESASVQDTMPSDAGKDPEKIKQPESGPSPSPGVPAKAIAAPTEPAAENTPASKPTTLEGTVNLLSFLASGKAPERLAAQRKHLSRMEFVQTMVTLLYTDTEYVDQLYANYLSADY